MAAVCCYPDLDPHKFFLLLLERTLQKLALQDVVIKIETDAKIITTIVDIIV